MIFLRTLLYESIHWKYILSLYNSIGYLNWKLDHGETVNNPSSTSLKKYSKYKSILTLFHSPEGKSGGKFTSNNLVGYLLIVGEMEKGLKNKCLQLLL